MIYHIKRNPLLSAIMVSALLCAPMAKATQEHQLDSDTALPLAEIQRFAEVFDKIKRDYVEPISDEELLTLAIRGMLSGLDPHSVYLDASSYENLQVDTEGQFGGLGIEIAVERGVLKVISPIDDTPASRAGILAGDVITQIDGNKTAGMSQAETIDLLRGKPGSKVTLKIVRQGNKTPFDVTLKRAIINIASVKSELLEDDFGYIRITQFQRETGLSLRKAIAKLKQQSNNQLSGVVLDLRNNPGGILGAAVDVSNSFLKSGPIVSTKGRQADVRSSYSASEPDLIEGLPMVVLVNSGSASAAEIVAGALQDHDRAVIMGTTTFGKGSVQTIFPLDASAAVKFTTARYYTPDDRSIQATGVVPDIVVEQRNPAAAQTAGQGVRESDLPGHLENEQNQTAEADRQRQDNDHQLAEAIKLLRGIKIAGANSKAQG